MENIAIYTRRFTLSEINQITEIISESNLLEIKYFDTPNYLLERFMDYLEELNLELSDNFDNYKVIIKPMPTPVPPPNRYITVDNANPTEIPANSKWIKGQWVDALDADIISLVFVSNTLKIISDRRIFITETSNLYTKCILEGNSPPPPSNPIFEIKVFQVEIDFEDGIYYSHTVNPEQELVTRFALYMTNVLRKLSTKDVFDHLVEGHNPLLYLTG